MKTFSIFTHFFANFLPTLAALMLFSCTPPSSSSEAAAAPQTPNQILRAVQVQNPASLYTSDTIAPKANIVLIAPGGPVFEQPALGDLIKNDSAYARVMVKQEQMIRAKNGQIPTDRFISDAEAREINLYSAARLYALAKDFQAKGHKVSLFSRSFGSFIVPEMLRQYGDAPFTKIFIAVGRLDMPMEVVKGFANGEIKTFNEDGKTIAPSRGGVDALIAQVKNNIPNFCALANVPAVPNGMELPAKMAKAICVGNTVDTKKETAFKFQLRSGMQLQADLAQNRYSQILKGKNLGKITYYFGGKDKNVGRLTKGEVRFLTGRVGFTIDSPPRSATWYSTANFTITFPGGRTSNRIMHIITGASNHATVKYDLLAGHFPLLEQIKKDIVAAF